MPQVKVRPVTRETVWEGFLKHRPEASFLQSWYWGNLQHNLGHRVERVGFYRNDELIGVMLSVVEKAKRATYLTIGGGPLIDWADKPVVDAFITEAKQQAIAQKCSFIRIRPQLEENRLSISLFLKLGFIKSPMHLGAELTHQLDLTASEDDILLNMRKSTRYEIRKAIKLNIKVTTSTDPQDIAAFYQHQLETAQRQGFTPFSYDFLYEQFRIFAQQGKVLLYSAYSGKKLLAQAFVIFYGQEAVYHYGISTQDGRTYPGAYLIQWEAIKEAKRRGLKRYNFWGVADDPNHRYYNLSIFKRGFGGYDYTYVHAQDLPVKMFQYCVNYVIEYIRKKQRKL